MISVAVFTYRRKERLNQCLESLQSKSVNEILLFNDDETHDFLISQINISDRLKAIITIYNPSDFGFVDRAFRKPIYLNRAVELAENDIILFSDDDGIFTSGSVEQHVRALKKYEFCAGSIIRNRFLKQKSRSILQGTNYSFNKIFYNKLGGYDEAYMKSQGGGDVDFWYRIYNYVKLHKLTVAFLPDACQNVIVKSQRKKCINEMDPRKYTLNKHDLNIKGPMYKWFPEIRDKSQWMKVING